MYQIHHPAYIFCVYSKTYNSDKATLEKPAYCA